MADQLDMFGSPSTDAEDVGTLIDDPVVPVDPVESVDPVDLVTPAVFDAMARFLAGMIYRTDSPYERLTAAQRKTAERAARAALNEFKEDTNGP